MEIGMIEIIGRATCTTCRKAFALLEEKKVEYRFRDYMKEPLERGELEDLMELLGLGVQDLLRKKDKAYKELGLTGKEDEGVLLGHMLEHPGLVQRPIAKAQGKAIVARPFDTILELVED
tara:strand:- start:1040 stop:1399 length:360 start_codon:yes stop_codon:yes gene_type:complete